MIEDEYGRALLADPDEEIREALLGALRRQFPSVEFEQVDAVSKVAEVIAVAKKEHPFDVAIMELPPPVGTLGAIEAAEEIMRSVKRVDRNVEILFVTSRRCSAKDENRLLELGAVDVLVKPFHRKLPRVFTRVGTSLARSNRLRKGDLLKEQAKRDSGVPIVYSRRALYESVGAYVEQGRDVAVIFLDIDRFKNYNDSYGHETGNQVIDCLARSLRKACGWPLRGGTISEENSEDLKVRHLDSAADRAVAIPFRYGGDEFVVALVGAPNAKEGGDGHRENLEDLGGRSRELVEKIRVGFGEYCGNVEEVSAPPGLSFGAAHLPAKETGYSDGFRAGLASILTSNPRNVALHEQLIDLADQCLILAKKAGRGRLVMDTELTYGVGQVVDLLTTDSLLVDKGNRDGLHDPLHFCYEVRQTYSDLRAVREDRADWLQPPEIVLESIDLKIKKSLASSTVAEIASTHGPRLVSGVRGGRIVWVSRRRGGERSEENERLEAYENDDS